MKYTAKMTPPTVTTVQPMTTTYVANITVVKQPWWRRVFLKVKP